MPRVRMPTGISPVISPEEKPFIRVTPYLLCPPETPLKLDDIIRREKDGAHYRVCSRPEDRRTPLCAGFPYAEVRLERMEADA